MVHKLENTCHVLQDSNTEERKKGCFLSLCKGFKNLVIYFFKLKDISWQAWTSIIYSFVCWGEGLSRNFFLLSS